MYIYIDWAVRIETNAHWIYIYIYIYIYNIILMFVDRRGTFKALRDPFT
jgi:hypothetical protein